MAGCCHGVERSITERRGRQTRMLWVVLAINAVMFVVEFGAGSLASSTALLGDSLDMCTTRWSIRPGLHGDSQRTLEGAPRRLQGQHHGYLRCYRPLQAYLGCRGAPYRSEPSAE